ncbi:MAG: hypothetical protein PHQ80_04640 [Candidatus ainarchaeum sp.]|nr:hypothetical protein [Candidatus ainarchaeum sp.]MDD5096054.1 hypothetical protein [Candidatus ainarchaeum sp.]
MAGTGMAQSRQQDVHSVFESAAGRIMSHPSIASLGANETLALSKKIGELTKQFNYEYSAGPVPSEQTTLFWLGLKLTGTPAEQAVRELLSGAGTGPAFQLPQPALLREEPAQRPSVTPATRPHRTSSVPTVSGLRRQGYTNILDVRFGEEDKLYRFASNDPNLDLVGMTRQQLIDYAKNNPGAMRIFEVNDRGYATREVRPSAL